MVLDARRYAKGIAMDWQPLIGTSDMLLSVMIGREIDLSFGESDKPLVVRGILAKAGDWYVCRSAGKNYDLPAVGSWRLSTEID